METKRLIKECKNGTKVWGVREFCCKCNGTGKVIWSYANHVCFDCDGKGWYEVKQYEFTPEHQAKIEAKRARENQKRAEEAARLAKEREAFEAARKAELEAIERERRGHFFGEVGQKIEMEVTFIFASAFESMYGWTNVYRMDGDNGERFVWKSSAELGGHDWMIYEGDKITIKATIKGHKEYHGVEQTELTRVKVTKAVHKYGEEQ